MAEAKGRLEWGQTSQVLAMLYNVNRSGKDRVMYPDDFNPYGAKRKKPLAQVSLTDVAKLFVR